MRGDAHHCVFNRRYFKDEFISSKGEKCESLGSLAELDGWDLLKECTFECYAHVYIRFKVQREFVCICPCKTHIIANQEDAKTNDLRQ